MNPTQSRAVGAALSFLFIFLSGLWLNRSGMPYSTIMLTIHKLITLATIAFIVVTVYRRHQLTPLSMLEMITIIITGLLFVGTIATGGLLSINRTMPAAVHRLHQMTPFVTVFVTAVTLYLLLSKTASSLITHR